MFPQYVWVSLLFFQITNYAIVTPLGLMISPLVRNLTYDTDFSGSLLWKAWTLILMCI